MFKKITILLICCVIFYTGFSQNAKNYYMSPRGNSFGISDNFGEIRPNHFHMGLDVNAQVGDPVFSVADGFVSRIAVNAGGYGNVLYIDHPNGTTSVYAHLYEFIPEVKSVVDSIQFSDSTFEIDFYPEKNIIKVRKGQIIGKAGNSGRSFSPHLHFEIRDTESESPINILKFFPNPADISAPTVSRLAIYPLSAESSVNGKQNMQSFKVFQRGNKYFIKEKPVCYGEIGFAFTAADRAKGASGRMAVYKARLFVDKQPVTEFALDTLEFATSLDVNSFCDYEIYNNSGIKYQKMFAEPGNRLKIYKHFLERGIVNFIDNDMHEIEIRLFDEKNHQTSLVFNIVSKNEKKNIEQQFVKENARWDSVYRIVKQNVRFEIEKMSLYSDAYIEYFETPSVDRFLSNIYTFGNADIPLIRPFRIAIKPDFVPDSVPKSKIVVVRILPNGNLKSLGGELLNDFVCAQSRYFGRFTLALDTVAPVIIAENFLAGDDLSSQKNLIFSLSDQLSGLENYRAYIDSKRVLFSFDEKNSQMLVDIVHLPRNNVLHSVKIITEDKKNNTAIFLTHFFK